MGAAGSGVGPALATRARRAWRARRLLRSRLAVRSRATTRRGALGRRTANPWARRGGLALSRLLHPVRRTVLVSRWSGLRLLRVVDAPWSLHGPRPEGLQALRREDHRGGLPTPRARRRDRCEQHRSQRRGRRYSAERHGRGPADETPRRGVRRVGLRRARRHERAARDAAERSAVAG